VKIHKKGGPKGRLLIYLNLPGASRGPQRLDTWPQPLR